MLMICKCQNYSIFTNRHKRWRTLFVDSRVEDFQQGTSVLRSVPSAMTLSMKEKKLISLQLLYLLVLFSQANAFHLDKRHHVLKNMTKLNTYDNLDNPNCLNEIRNSFRILVLEGAYVI